MACSGRYAQSWEFVAFWCGSSLLSRTHTGANDAALLTDSQADFIRAGIRANAGMLLYNVTDGSVGAVTEVTETTLAASLAGGTDNHWDASDVYRIVSITGQEIAQIEFQLDTVSSDLHAALSAQGMCDCTLAEWAAGFLKKLNIIEARAFYECSCMVGNMSDEHKAALLAWAGAQMDLIRTGKLELCAGATGAEYPAFGNVEIAHTEFSAARIEANRMARNGL